jgi:16S rRNA (guanine1207-N2)-methyltransferase
MTLEVTIRDIALQFRTHSSLFSPQRVDAGTLALLSALELDPQDKLLDLACGYGVMGIYAAKRLSPAQVFMIDKDPLAIECARANVTLNGVEGVRVAISDGLRDFHEAGFTKIVCNPPYHTDFSVAKHFIEKGFNRLLLGGALWLVTKRDAWYRNKLMSVFGGTRVREIDSYYVFESIRKGATYANRAAGRR